MRDANICTLRIEALHKITLNITNWYPYQNLVVQFSTHNYFVNSLESPSPSHGAKNWIPSSHFFLFGVKCLSMNDLDQPRYYSSFVYSAPANMARPSDSNQILNSIPNSCSKQTVSRSCLIIRKLYVIHRKSHPMKTPKTNTWKTFINYPSSP